MCSPKTIMFQVKPQSKKIRQWLIITSDSFNRFSGVILFFCFFSFWISLIISNFSRSLVFFYYIFFNFVVPFLNQFIAVVRTPNKWFSFFFLEKFIEKKRAKNNESSHFWLLYLFYGGKFPRWTPVNKPIIQE